MSWDWQVFCEDTLERQVVQGCFGKGGDITYLDWMLSAWGWTVSVSVLALLLALVLGSFIGTLRTLQDRPVVVRLGNAWVELFRNIPLLVQIFLWYHVVPTMFPAMKAVPGFVLVVLALGFLPRRALPNRCARAYRHCRAVSATQAWPWASPRFRPTAMCCCPWRFASSFRR